MGVGQINGAGANGLDFRQDGFDFFIFAPKRILAGVLFLLLPHREVASTAHQHRGAACTVSVVVVRPLCKAAGVAVKQRVQLFVIVWADFLLLFFDQSGGFVHAGTVFSGCVAVRVGAHAAHIVGSTGQSVELAPGAFIDLNPGEEVQFADPKHPTTGFEAFMNAIVKQMAAALEIPSEVLYKQFSTSYSAARGALNEFWRTTGINGVFNCVCIVDIDSSTAGATKYDDVKRQKEKQAVTSANCYAVWLYAKVGDVIYAGSAMAAAATVATDANNGDIPNVSPDNKPISISAACLKDGTEVLLDQEQANVVNSFGVATWLNMNGFRLWGNNTACYPGNTDPKDRWFSVRRFFCWDDNTFIQTYFQKVSDPLNKRLIEALVDSENVRGNSFVSRGICARYELQYIESENPTTDLLNGTVKFHKYMSPFNPAEDIEEIVEFDPNAISTALAG